MATRVKLNHAGMAALLKSEEIVTDLMERGNRALEVARAHAPVDSGQYVASLYIDAIIHPSRAVVRVGAAVAYGMAVEADHGTLAFALDFAR